MAVYVDDMRAPYGRMVMCHMLADTTQELMEMAAKIGVASKWLQKAGTAQEHFDVCMTKRAKAVAEGAKEVTIRDVALMCRAKRQRATDGMGP